MNEPWFSSQLASGATQVAPPKTQHSAPVAQVSEAKAAVEERRRRGMARDAAEKAQMQAQKAEKARGWREKQITTAWKKQDEHVDEAAQQEQAKERSTQAGLELQQLSQQRLKRATTIVPVSDTAQTTCVRQLARRVLTVPTPQTKTTPKTKTTPATLLDSPSQRPRTTAFRLARAARIATRLPPREAQNHAAAAGEEGHRQGVAADVAEAAAAAARLLSVEAKREESIARREAVRVERARVAAAAYSDTWESNRQHQATLVNSERIMLNEQQAAAAKARAASKEQQQQREVRRKNGQAARAAARQKRCPFRLMN
jgi:hypothetical protein